MSEDWVMSEELEKDFRAFTDKQAALNHQMRDLNFLYQQVVKAQRAWWRAAKEEGMPDEICSIRINSTTNEVRYEGGC